MFSRLRIVAHYPSKLPRAPDNNTRGFIGWAAHIINLMTSRKIAAGEILDVRRIGQRVLEARYVH